MRTEAPLILNILLLPFFLLLGHSTFGQEFSWSTGTRDVLENKANVPIFPWFPDGHIAVLPEVQTDDYIMYWSGHENYRTTGAYAFPEFHQTLVPEEKVFGGRKETETWDNGGSWLMSVFRQNNDTLLAFYHAEDHWEIATNPEGIAWKSLARTLSVDNGETWSEGEQIIISASNKPEVPIWGGAGDNSVIWDHKNNRWLCFYQEHWLKMALSYDEEGKPGTWYKYHNGDFNQPGMGGESSPIPGLMSKPGGNPSIHFNTYLDRFIIVWHSWVSTSVYMSSSIDGVNWETPRLLEPNTGLRRAWYPTIIGSSDIEAGKIARLYYADISRGFSSRNFVSKALVFDKDEAYEPQTTWQQERIGEVPVIGLMDQSVTGKLRMVAYSGSINATENVEFYYKNIEGSFLFSGKFQLDDIYNNGSVGLSIRSGFDEQDPMAVIVLEKDQLSYFSRAQTGQIGLDNGTPVDWSSHEVWLQIEKLNGEVICRYSSDGDEWSRIGSIPFEYDLSRIGFIAMGSPDEGCISYVDNLEETELQDAIPINCEDTSFSNPSKGQIFINYSDCFSHFEIFDYKGKRRLNSTIEGNTINIQSLNPGFYVLTLYNPDDDFRITEKLIIVN